MSDMCGCVPVNDEELSVDKKLIQLNIQSIELCLAQLVVVKGNLVELDKRVKELELLTKGL